MKDIIYREDAISTVKKWFDFIELNGDICIDGLISLPSAERTGHWIKDGHHIICDQCGATMCDTDREGDPIPRDFCPSCGTRMVTE